MTLEKRLEVLSHESDRNLKLYQTWGTLKRIFTQKLESVSLYFPHFSLHNATHSETICMQIEKILGEVRISKLSPTDIWMLLSSFYAHDLGMAIEFEEINDFFQKDEFRKELSRLSLLQDEISLAAKRLLCWDSKSNNNQILGYSNSLELYNDIQIIIEDNFRNFHARRSCNYIKSHAEIFSNIPERFVNLLGDICEQHQKNIESIMDLPYKSNGISNDYMHPRFIAALLCLGDLLDLDNDRFNEYIIKSAGKLPKNSYLHLLKHKSVQHFLVEPEGIEIKFDTESIDVYRLMRDWCNWIEIVCDFLSKNWSVISPKDFGMAPTLRKKDLLLNHSRKWLEYSDLHFSISNKRAFELLKGANIYRNKFVCIREIMQNSVDATLIHIWKELQEKDRVKYNSSINPNDLEAVDFSHYQIQITVSIDSEKNVIIEVRDYGTGISTEDLKAIANIETKYNQNRSSIISTMPEWFKPSGAFGLGLQSIFLIANRFEIITKTDDEAAKRIILESASDDSGYIIVDDYKKHFTRGTKTTIKIDSSKINLNDLSCSEYHFKTEPRCNLIVSAINSTYNNKSHNVAPIVIMHRQLTDYIPIQISCYNPYLQKEQIILQYDSLFSNFNKLCTTGILDSREGYILFKYYDKSFMNICTIEILEVANNNGIYGKCSHGRGDLGSTLFFKNVFVRGELVGYGFNRKIGFYRNIDFSINILASNAEEMLSISRDDIKKDYSKDIKKVCEISIINSIHKLIDNMISESLNVGTAIIKLYQLAIHLNYQVGSFLSAYKSQLESYSFDNYYDKDCQPVEFTFDELNNHSIYFFIEKIHSNIVPNSKNDEIQDLTDRGKYCLILKNEKSSREQQHILSHEIIGVFIAKYGGEYFKCIEAKAFHSTVVNCNYYKDYFLILDDFICAIFHSLRCMHANKKYIQISTEIKTDFGYREYYFRNYQVIELPFNEEQIMQLKSVITSEEISEFNAQGFIEETLESDKYKSNLKYIAEHNSISLNEVNQAYGEFLNDLLEMITDNANKSYIKSYLSFLQDHYSWKEGMHEIIDNNSYITI